MKIIDSYPLCQRLDTDSLERCKKEATFLMPLSLETDMDGQTHLENTAMVFVWLCAEHAK